MKKVLIFIILIFFSKNSYAFFNSNKINTPQEKIKVLFTDFKYQQQNNTPIKKEDLKLINKVIKLINDDLINTELFYVENKIDIKNKNPKAYARKDFEAIITGSIKNINKNKLKIQIKLQDFLLKDKDAKIIARHEVDNNNWIYIGHLIAEKIYEKLAGEEAGYFNSRILYTDSNNKKSRISITDIDKKNIKHITDGKSLIYSPIFSKKNNNTIFYIEKIDNSLKIQQLNILSGKKSQIGENIELLKKITLIPNLTINDENVLLFSATKNQAVNIYKLDTENNELTKITYNKFTDINPVFSSDNKKIIFQSNRSGSQKIYIMDIDGKNIGKISHNRGSYTKPIPSPDGKKIAFIKKHKGKSHLAIINIDGQKERKLISAQFINNIKWSSNNKYLLYSKKDGIFGGYNVYIMDISNKIEHKIPLIIKWELSDIDWNANTVYIDSDNNL